MRNYPLFLAGTKGMKYLFLMPIGLSVVGHAAFAPVWYVSGSGSDATNGKTPKFPHHITIRGCRVHDFPEGDINAMYQKKPLTSVHKFSKL